MRALALFLSMAVAPLAARAHGSNKPGPHGGFVRMPGSFHTEVLDRGNGTFEVYLLDVRIQNAVVENSAVMLAFVPKGGAPAEAKCVVGSESFTCTIEKFPG